MKISKKGIKNGARPPANGTTEAVAGLVEKLAEDRMAKLLEEIHDEHKRQLLAAHRVGFKLGRESFARQLMEGLGLLGLPTDNS